MSHAHWTQGAHWRAQPLEGARLIIVPGWGTQLQGNRPWVSGRGLQTQCSKRVHGSLRRLIVLICCRSGLLMLGGHRLVSMHEEGLKGLTREADLAAGERCVL